MVSPPLAFQTIVAPEIAADARTDGLEVPAQIKEYVNAFFGAVDAAKIMKESQKEYGEPSIAEFTASKDKLAK